MQVLPINELKSLSADVIAFGILTVSHKNSGKGGLIVVALLFFRSLACRAAQDFRGN
jgi:hypothetical protein